MKIVFHGKIIAQSEHTIVLEGTHYFPQRDVCMKYLETSNLKSICPWKGEARYYHVEVYGRRSDNAAWEYPCPTPHASHIKNHIAFRRCIQAH